MKVLIYNYCRTQSGIKLHWFYSSGRLYNFDARVTPAVKVIIKLVRKERATWNIYIHVLCNLYTFDAIPSIFRNATSVRGN